MRQLGMALFVVAAVFFVGGTMTVAIAQEAPAQATEQAPQTVPVQAEPQVAEPQAALEQEVDYSWGTVVQASVEGITLEQYNYETEGYDQVSYIVAGDISLENIAALTDLKVGDEVEVGFVIKDDKKVAISLYLEVLDEDWEEEE
ncbi:MAG TPA: hypothetical protein VLJ10_05160 [Candidatus Bathyarchaeia archaeon]|nr:hypothetical protein [Candidatus Bathyarchaeia archaeon]